MSRNTTSHCLAMPSVQLASSALITLLCLAVVPRLEAAAIYKTYDEQGNVVFTDQPLDEASAELVEPPVVNVADPLPVAPKAPAGLPPSAIPVLPSPAPVVNASGQSATPGTTPATATDVTVPATADQNAQGTATAPPTGVQTSNADATVAAPVPGTATAIDASAVQGTPASDEAAVAGTLEPTSDTAPTPTTERVAIPVLPAGANPPVIGTAVPGSETTVSIQWPEPDEIVLSTESPIWVQVRTAPTPMNASNLSAEVWIDDKLAVSGDRPLLPLVLPEVGLHKLQVRLVDDEGNSIAESDSQLMDVRLGATQTRQ